MASPMSAQTQPSTSASAAPTTQTRMHCGPFMARMMKGMTTNGPMPTMNVMLSDVASSRPRPRSSFSGSLISFFSQRKNGKHSKKARGGADVKVPAGACEALEARVELTAKDEERSFDCGPRHRFAIEKKNTRQVA